MQQESRNFSEKSRAVLRIPRPGVERRKTKVHETGGWRWLKKKERKKIRL